LFTLVLGTRWKQAALGFQAGAACNPKRFKTPLKPTFISAGAGVRRHGAWAQAGVAGALHSFTNNYKNDNDF